MILSFNNRVMKFGGILDYAPSTAPSQNIVTAGLILNLDAANDSSYAGTGTLWGDLSSEGNNATMVNTPTFVTSPNRYFTFDGGSITATGQVDSFAINDDASLDTLSSLSIEMWLNINQVQGIGSANMLFSKRAVNTNGYVGFFTNNSFVFRIGTISPTQLLWSTTPSIGVWQQIVITVGSIGSKVYHNGIEVVDSAYVGNFSNIDTNANLLIGDVNPNNSGLFGYKGDISVFRMYNTILSSSDVSQNYNAIINRYN